MKTKAKPCPFCGAELQAKFVSRFGLYHPDSDCILSGKRAVTACGWDSEFPYDVQFDDVEFARWNRRASGGGSGWQPWETAPKDGNPFLAWVNGEDICIVQWSHAGNYWLWDGDVYGDDIPDYTDWMPLPAPPQ